MNNNTTNQIAVFLDVDGVINSLNHLYEDGDFHMSAPAKPYQAGKYRVWVPDYMGALIRAIYKSTDLYWLTTWRDKANKYIPHPRHSIGHPRHHRRSQHEKRAMESRCMSTHS